LCSDYACLGYRNREAALRISPTVSVGDESVAKQYNLEFRPLDATASPHLAMAGLLIAGRLGIEQQLALTAVTDIDPHKMTNAEREARGIAILPSNLSLALQNLQNDKDLLQALPKPLIETYFSLKRQELALTSELDDATICEKYYRLY
jgi:glutamine synthetase